MGDRIKAFWLGIFIIVGIVLTAWLILFLKPSVGDGRLTLTVRFSNIDKVESGTRVTFAGKPVGEVYKIIEVPHPRESPSDEFGNLYIYELTLKVDSTVHVYSYDEIVFATSGLLGEKSIAIVPKAAPPGAPPPQEVTQEVLFARSTDKLDQILHQISGVSDSLTDTMEGVNTFLAVNTNDFNQTLKSISGAADQVKVFVADVNDQKVVNQINEGLASIHQITNGEGTIGKLIHSDSLYLQLSGLMCKVDTLLNDINHYGLLFQYDKGWQRTRTARMNQMKKLCSPCDFYNYFDHEVCEISVTMNRLGQVIQTMECREIPVQSECFAEGVRRLMSQVECLQDSLKTYTEMLTGTYCQECYCQ
ncbi:MAG: hypothetical protein S4CHLAM2_02670 [Chlamydiales bacterium]|nr:hypothetical protein [Chlamydiales bacterium]